MIGRQHVGLAIRRPAAARPEIHETGGAEQHAPRDGCDLWERASRRRPDRRLREFRLNEATQAVDWAEALRPSSAARSGCGRQVDGPANETSSFQSSHRGDSSPSADETLASLRAHTSRRRAFLAERLICWKESVL